jgi:hypothetical protein
MAVAFAEQVVVDEQKQEKVTRADPAESAMAAQAG